MKNKIEEKLDNNTIGVIGEYLVAAELEMHGFSASLLMKNTKDYDILAISKDGKHKYAIQVKTTQTNKNEWTLSKKNERNNNDDLFYVFVTLHHGNYYEYHIVHSKTVASYIKRDHNKWLKEKRSRKDNTMRKFRDPDNKYLNNWKFLK